MSGIDVEDILHDIRTLLELDRTEVSQKWHCHLAPSVSVLASFSQAYKLSYLGYLFSLPPLWLLSILILEIEFPKQRHWDMGFCGAVSSIRAIPV